MTLKGQKKGIPNKKPNLSDYRAITQTYASLRGVEEATARKVINKNI